MFETVMITGIDTPILACTICGALVWYDRRGLHEDFHAWMREQNKVGGCA